MSHFRKPSDLLANPEKPTIDDIRRVLSEYTPFLNAEKLPRNYKGVLTRSSTRKYAEARKIYGTQALRWEANWEEAGKYLGFTADPELRVLINTIYAPSERNANTRLNFWATEGSAFQHTVKTIREYRHSPQDEKRDILSRDFVHIA